MDPVLLLVVVVIVVALAFDYTNGFHDAANAIATSISTRALTPRVALLMAAVFNFIGAFLGEGVAVTIGSGIIDPPDGYEGLVVVLAALVAAIAWNVATWWLGLPLSTSQALIGGLGGAGLAAGATVHWPVMGESVLIPMVLSPVLALVLAYGAMIALLWACRRSSASRVNRRFRIAQTVSAAAMALGHGLQDAQKTMGVMVLALAVGGYHSGEGIPLWVQVTAALVIALGTYAGGWRIIRTLGRRIVDLDPARGFVAETVSAGILYVAAIGFHAPVSTSQAISSAVVGVGVSKRLSAVRWRVARALVVAWLLTLPVAGLLGATSYVLLAAVL